MIYLTKEKIKKSETVLLTNSEVFFSEMQLNRP